YPLIESYAHVVGYVGAVSKADLNGNPLLSLPGFKIGKTAIEKIYDKRLRGEHKRERGLGFPIESREVWF
ncbi:MAG: hypothetical protein ACPGYY_07785, partial [Bacteroidia bacterium]